MEVSIFEEELTKFIVNLHIWKDIICKYQLLYNGTSILIYMSKLEIYYN